MYSQNAVALICFFICSLVPSFQGMSQQSVQNAAEEIRPDQRFIAIDNVCAWPNVILLKDGVLLATIYNRPDHGTTSGGVECWASKDGRFWQKRGDPAPPDGNTNRIHYAVGHTKNGELVAIVSGWSLKPDEKPLDNAQRGAIIRAWISRSRDGGKTWVIDKQGFPSAGEKTTDYIPFGAITSGADGSLRAACYTVSRDGKRTFSVSMLRSDDDGVTWKPMSIISDAHNETTAIHLGNGKWLAACRNETTKTVDLFSSEDDGKHWQYKSALTRPGQLPADFAKLGDGRIAVTFGNRIPGQYGVSVRFSDDEGKTWGKELALVSDLTKGDCGYPSSVQLKSGKILTAYYAAGVGAHERYHMGVVEWTPPTK